MPPVWPPIVPQNVPLVTGIVLLGPMVIASGNDGAFVNL